MEQQQQRPVREVDRRASRRRHPRSTLKMECRKGTLGLGPNLLQSILDLSETGVRVIVKANLEKGKEVEILLVGGHQAQAVKRAANVVWCLPTENNLFCAGLHFHRPLSY